MARELRTVSQTPRKESTLSFFDDGDEPRTAIRPPKPRPRRPPAGGRRSRADDRTLLLRRGLAAGVVLVVLIGLVLVIKTVLNNQAVQGLKTYDGEVNALVAGEQANVRVSFFRTIDNSFNSPNPAEVPITLQQIISQEQTYYNQAQGWSVPAQMVGAQRWLVGALGLRLQALQTIATQMKAALAVSADQTQAIKLIAGAMETLLTSDGIYAQRVAPLIAQELTKAAITGQSTSPSVFLPDIGWVDPATVAQRILGYIPTSLGGTPVNGSPGHELLGVTVPISGTSTALVSGSGTTNRIPYTTAGITFTLSVKNSGTLIEHQVQTDISFYKAGLDTKCLTSTNPIPTTRPGLTYTSSIVFAPSSCANISAFFNTVLLMTAEVVPLQGETDKANNVQHFYVEFTH
jgi:hypothetical protein